MEAHYRKLEKMYLNAPVQKLYPGIRAEISEGSAQITLPVNPSFFHAGQAVHGSVYFRLLDDAAYFAVNSVVFDVFMLTTSFHTELLRPVTGGTLISKGRIIHQSKKMIIAESVLWDDHNKKIALGKGVFMRSNTSLNQIPGYENS